jgi:hypothetical protein
MTVRAYPLQPAELRREAGDQLVRRLFPSVRYEIAQIATALAVNAAATTRWLASGSGGIEEVRASEKRSRLLILSADRLLRALTELGEVAASEIALVDLAELARVAIQISRHAAYQAGSIVRASSTARLPRVLVDPVATLRLLLELLLAIADADACVIEVGTKSDEGTVFLTIDVDGATIDGILAMKLESLIGLGQGCDAVRSTSVVRQRVELAFPVAPVARSGTSCRADATDR